MSISSVCTGPFRRALCLIQSTGSNPAEKIFGKPSCVVRTLFVVIGKSSKYKTLQRYLSRPFWVKKCLDNSSVRLSLFSSGAIGFSLASNHVVTAASLPFSGDKDRVQKMLLQADSLFDASKFEELYILLLRYNLQDGNNDEIKWRLARATYHRAKGALTNDSKVKLLMEAKSYVSQALKINPDNFAAHKWAAILVIELAEQEGTKAKIQQSVVSKEHMIKAHQLNPTDGTTLYLLGVWCYSFAELSWTQRKLASVVFATPPTSTFEEALDYFSKAEASEPNFYSKNLLMLGKTYLKLNDKEKGISFLKRARDYPLKTAEDKEATKEAADLLKTLGVS